MEWAPPWEPTLYTFLTILTRVASFWVLLPVMRRGVPLWTKVGAAAFISALLVPLVAPAVPESSLQFFLWVLGEALVGLVLGFMVSLVFSTLYLAGHLIDVSVAFGAESLFDPQTGDHVPMLGQFQNAVAVLLFFLLNGHHALLASVAQSFDVIPVGQAQMNASVVQTVFDAFTALFVLSVRIALPVVAAVFLTDVALGIMNRAVPQMNMFVVGFPVKIGVGLFVYMLAVGAVVAVLGQLVGETGTMAVYVRAMLRALGTGP